MELLHNNALVTGTCTGSTRLGAVGFWVIRAGEICMKDQLHLMGSSNVSSNSHI